MKMNLWLAGGMILLGLAHLALAQAPAEINVPTCQTPPQLDAELTDPAWSKALKLAGFTRIGTDQPASAQTTVWLCRDDTWLYVAFRCAEPDPGSIRQIVTLRDDSVFDDDCVEVFIDNGNDGASYIELLLSVGNVQADQLCKDTQRLRYWDLSWRSAARADPSVDTSKGWSAEMAIPLALIQKQAGPHNWKINFARIRQACTPSEYSSLAAIPEGAGFQSPQSFIPIKGLSEVKAKASFGPMLREATAASFSISPAGNYTYQLKVKVKNETGCGGTVEVVGHDVPQKGEGQQTVQNLTLGPTEEKAVILTIPVAAPGPRAAWVGLRKPNASAWLQKMNVPQMDRLLPLNACLDRNYYTTEAEARLHLQIAVPLEERQKIGLTINVELVDANGQVLQTEKTKCLDNAVVVPLSLKNVSEGSSRVAVTILDGQKRILGSLDLLLVKRPPAPEGSQEVKIDQYNRCILLNGRPFFPVGVFGMGYFDRFNGQVVSGDTRKAFKVQYQYCREAGFNTVIDWAGYGPPDKPVEDCQANYDLARQYGLFVIGLPIKHGGVYPGDTNYVDYAIRGIEGITPYIEMARRHPAIIAYYSFDEPPPELPGNSNKSMDDLLANYYTKLYALDPYHPVYMSLTRVIAKPRWFDTVADLLGSHNYWLVSQPETLNWIPQWCEMIDRHAIKADNPTILALQLEFFNDYTFMSPAEQRASTYFALVHGARSLMYFALPFHHQAVVTQQAELSREIHTMAPALLTRSPVQKITFEPKEAMVTGWRPDLNFPLVQTLLKNRPEGGQLLLAINAARQPVTTRFTVSSLTPRSTVSNLFQNTMLAVSNGSFTETFEPLGTRAYVLTETRLPPNAAVKMHLAMSGPALVSNAPAGPPVVASVLKNGGFEDKGGWQEEYMGSVKWGTLKRVQEKPHGEKSCLKISKAQASGSADVVSEPVTLKPGTPYRVRGWIRAALKKGAQSPCLSLLSVQKKSAGQRTVNLLVGAQEQISGQWQEVVGKVTTPKGPAEAVRLWCRVPDGCVGEVWFDDLAIEELASNKEKKNLVANSSFEQAVLPGLPDHWFTPGRNELAPDPRACGQDERNPFHGKYCYRIISYQAGSYDAQVYQQMIMTKPGKTYTLSAYLRTDTAGATVRLNSFGLSTEVAVEAEWKRYVLTGPAPTNDVNWQLIVRAVSVGNFYVDAVQIEEGPAATAYEEP